MNHKEIRPTRTIHYYHRTLAFAIFDARRDQVIANGATLNEARERAVALLNAIPEELISRLSHYFSKIAEYWNWSSVLRGAEQIARMVITRMATFGLT